ncbi:putative Protein lifeguard 2 [Hypsibius exemplaris]|uniref:Protein lifeguard 2 n=1 Tax=Hypsibius exemplaris TaxID=2072580 RepID=A0A1W0X7X4_HYPEX|nr:putative Protein lifeguard 2 [Hypsibius exemplaris]
MSAHPNYHPNNGPDVVYVTQHKDDPPPYLVNTYPASGPQVFVGPVYTTTVDGQYMQPGTYPTNSGAYVATGVYPGYGEVGQTGQPPSGGDSETGHPSNFGTSFSDVNIRRRFVRNVYSILMVQLLVTLGFICLFIFSPDVKRFVRRNSWFYYLAYAVFIITYITLVCCPGVRRRYPTNLFLLAIFTLAMSYMTATISSYHDTKIVLMAVGICAVVCLVVSVSAAFCTFDMTKWGWLLGILALMLMLFGLITLMFAFIPGLRTPWYYGFYSGLIALVFMGFLAYDTQQILGGRRYNLSPEEHVYGALQLYLDVVYIFLGILGISGAASSN